MLTFVQRLGLDPEFNCASNDVTFEGGYPAKTMVTNRINGAAIRIVKNIKKRWEI